MEWLYDDPKTTEPGCYAILYSWDPHEGTFPGCAMWDGTGWLWTSNAVIVASAGPFQAAEPAKAWADENDPGY